MKTSFPFWAVRANGEVYGCNSRPDAVRKAGKGGEVRTVNPVSRGKVMAKHKSRKRNGSTMASSKHDYEEARREKHWREVGKPQQEAAEAAAIARGDPIMVATGGWYKSVRPGHPDYPKRNPGRRRNPPDGGGEVWYVSKDFRGRHTPHKSRSDALRAAGRSGTVYESPYSVDWDGARLGGGLGQRTQHRTLAQVEDARLAAHTVVIDAQKAVLTAKRAVIVAQEAEYRTRQAELSQRDTARQSAQIAAQEMLKATRAAEYELVEAAKNATAVRQKAEDAARFALDVERASESRARDAQRRATGAERSIAALRAQEARATIGTGQAAAPQKRYVETPHHEHFANLEID